MERGIDPSAPLEYVEFQMFPTQNRYEAYVQSNSKVEKIASGPLEQLLLHSPNVKDLCSRGSNAKFRIQPPDSRKGAEWFTISTLKRFLHIVGSPEILNITNEISQLEETRSFQVSLSAKTGRGGASSDGSKNELLRAMDLRLTALKEEFATAFNRATDAICSPKDIYQLENFSHLFGAEDIRNSFSKFVKVAPEDLTIDVQSDSNVLLMKDTPVKYGVSPAKVAQVERQSSTGSEASSLSSEEDQPSVGRSRTLLRPASPRRSASPMRRVQIGRSGSRRAALLSIKSLGYYPTRERIVSHRDETEENSSEDEGIEQPPKKNVLRMSVQDKISLFENKQKDLTVDVPKTKTLVNASVVPNKAVLRRWSSGMGESSVQELPDIVSESSEHKPPTNVAPEVGPKSVLKVNSLESAEIHVKPVSSELKVDIREVDRKESSEVNPASADWSRQKEAELNQLFMKMMETKPVRQQNDGGINSKNKNSPIEQRGGFYDHYKQKRDEKLRGEAAGKRAEKEAQFKVMQQFLDEKKAEMASTNISDVGRRNIVKKVKKPQKLAKNSSQVPSSKKESIKPSVPKKTTSKTTPLPATRKSWPSTPSPRTGGPSPRTAGPSPTKTPTGPTSAGTTPTRRKPQSASSIPRSSPNVEKSQPRPKILKATRDDSNKSVKASDEKKRQPVTKNGKSTKTKVQTTLDESPSLNAKPSFYNKVTRKGSVVPLESKPFLRKGTGVGPGVGPVVVKTKALPQPEEPSRNSGGLILAEDNDLVNSSDLIIENTKGDPEAQENCHNLQSETHISSAEKHQESENPDQVATSGDDCVKHIEISQNNPVNEEELELEISPTAWVEIDENQDEIVPCQDSPIQIAAPANVGISIPSPRVRHSLSQMLLEETSEADILEWGNAENPPAMVYQKDAPKGLKRLLKFARKSKADSHLTDLSGPSAFSEGEDEVEETRGSKRTSDLTLRKSSLHASNYGQPKLTSNETHEKNSDKSHISKYTAQNHQKMQEGHNAASGATAKATRSFFSLSAFRGSKPNETRLPYR